MAESTLSLAFTNLQTEVAYYLGYGRDTSVLSVAETNYVNALINSGCRRFYAPVKTEADRPSHEWSFMKPTTTITIFGDVTGTVSGNGVWATPNTTITATAASFYPGMVGMNFTFDTSSTDYEIVSYTNTTVIVVLGNASGEAADDTFTITSTGDFRLPDGFGGLLGAVTFAPGASYDELDNVGEERIRELRVSSETSAVPDYCAVRPLLGDGSTGQRFELMTYATPDTTYVMYYRYLALADQLSGTALYALGGMLHGETILESCLAVAEEREDPEKRTHRDAYGERLLASIELDRKRGPKNLGYMGDDSDLLRDRRDKSRDDHYAYWNNQLW